MFRDDQGREYSPVITVGTVEDAKRQLDVDLLTIVNGQLLETLDANPPLIVSCLYLCCKDSADAKGITPEDFGAAISGRTIDAALSALVEALIDFFPSRKRRQIRETLQKIGTAHEEAMELLHSTETENAIRRIVRETGSEALRRFADAGAPSGNSLGS